MLGAGALVICDERCAVLSRRAAEQAMSKPSRGVSKPKPKRAVDKSLVATAVAAGASSLAAIKSFLKEMYDLPGAVTAPLLKRLMGKGAVVKVRACLAFIPLSPLGFLARNHMHHTSPRIERHAMTHE
jgi:hypothetical protein